MFRVYSKLKRDNVLKQKLIQKYKIDDKTIILSPDAKSLNSNILKPNFWNDSGQTLQKLRYNILFNSYEPILKIHIFKQTKHLFQIHKTLQYLKIYLAPRIFKLRF